MFDHDFHHSLTRRNGYLPLRAICFSHMLNHGFSSAASGQSGSLGESCSGASRNPGRSANEWRMGAV